MTDRALYRRLLERQREWSSVDAGLWIFLVFAVAITGMISYCEATGYFAPISQTEKRAVQATTCSHSIREREF